MEVWYLSVATVTLQAVSSFTLLVREFRRKLGRAPAATTAESAATPDAERN
jgi:hypothetical protein